MVAMGQVLIYSGAIVVLFLFVVALLPQGGSEADLGLGRVLGGLVVGCALLAGLAAWLALAGPLPPAAPSAGGNVVEIGRSLFGRLIVPFELTAPLLAGGDRRRGGDLAPSGAGLMSGISSEVLVLATSRRAARDRGDGGV